MGDERPLLVFGDKLTRISTKPWMFDAHEQHYQCPSYDMDTNAIVYEILHYLRDHERRRRSPYIHFIDTAK